MNDIVKIKRVPKITLYEWIRDIKLSAKAQEKIRKNYIAKIIERNKTEKNFGFKRIKIKNKPKKWSKDLVDLVAHFLFDGAITKYACVYSSRNKSQINKMQSLMKKNFHLMPRTRVKTSEVIDISYYRLDLAKYIKEKAEKLLENILTMSKCKKRIFLQAFFDDEGCVGYANNPQRKIRRIRGYQHSKNILKLVQLLLKEFYIASYIDKRFTEITIGGKENLLKFQKNINFSPNIFINPERKNALWKTKIDKRTILQKAIASYKS